MQCGDGKEVTMTANRVAEQKAGQRVEAAVYCRTSKEDPRSKKVSNEQQVDDGRKLAQKMKLHVSPEHIYIDRDLSGKLPPPQWAKEGKTRPQFGKLITAIERGKVKAIIFRMRDRIARNTILSLQFWEFCEKCDVAVYATHEIMPAATDASGRFALTILIAAAQLQLEQTTANIKAAKDYAKRHGLKMCDVQTVGYKNGKRGEILKDELGENIVNEIYDLFIGGMSMMQIVHHCNATYPNSHPRHGKQWYCSTVRRILSNPAYINKATQQYPEIMTADKWLAAQQAYKARANAKWGVKLHKHLLSGFIKCGYDGETMVTFSRYSKGDTAKRIGFDIKCSRKHAGAHPFSMREMKWLEFVVQHLSSAKVVRTYSGAKVVDLELQLSRVETNLAGYKNQVNAGVIDLSEFAEMTRAAKANAAKIRTEIASLSATERRSAKGWHEMTMDEQRLRLHEICEKIETFDDGVLVYYRPNVTFADSADAVFGAADFGVPVWYPLCHVTGLAGKKQHSLVPEDDREWRGYEHGRKHGIECMVYGATVGCEPAPPDQPSVKQRRRPARRRSRQD